MPLVVWNIYVGITTAFQFQNNVTRRGINSWAYNKSIADYIYKDAKNDFGYFIFTPDRWVFNQRYALEYIQNKYPHIIAYPSQKKALTYLIVVDPPKNRPDIDPVGWKITDVGIKKDSISSTRIDVTTIYKYELTNEETTLPQNPYLLDSTFFR